MPGRPTPSEHCHIAWRRAPAALLAVLLSVFLSSAASAQNAVALVLDITGPSEPEIAALDELYVGSAFTLGPDTRISLMHYASCQEVAIRGGALTVEEKTLLLRGGEVVSKTRTECPMGVTVHEAALVGAGTVLRSITVRPKVSPTPSFLVARVPRGHTELRILSGKTVLMRSTVAGGRVPWNSADAPLAPGRYTVVLATNSEAVHAAQIEVTGDGAGLIVLRP